MIATFAEGVSPDLSHVSEVNFEVATRRKTSAKTALFHGRRIWGSKEKVRHLRDEDEKLNMAQSIITQVTKDGEGSLANFKGKLCFFA